MLLCLDGPCVGIYPMKTDSLPQLIDSYNLTLSSLSVQDGLIIILILSHLIPPDFQPLSLFNQPDYYALDRTHILFNLFMEPKHAHMDPQIADLALLSTYAAYDLKCSSFLAVESGTVASSALVDFMTVSTRDLRTNLADHVGLSALIWREKANVKIKPPFHRVSLRSGSHLLVPNLDETSNYIEKLSQTLLHLKPKNISVDKYLVKFSEMQAVNVPSLVLPPLINPSQQFTWKATFHSLHNDMASEKPKLKDQLQLSIKAFYSPVLNAPEYSAKYVVQDFGYFHSKEVFVDDVIMILLDNRHFVSSIRVTTGSPNQPEKRLKAGKVSTSPRGVQNSKSGKVSCQNQNVVGQFDTEGVLQTSKNLATYVHCIVIRIKSYQPDGFILYNIQMVP